MKIILNILLTAALLILTGCGKHPMPEFEAENQGNFYIFFGTGVVETRSNLVEGTSLPSLTGTDFGVFGLRPDGTAIFDRYIGGSNSTFNNVARQYRAGNNTAFSYDILALWHSGEHAFYAYYPYNSAKDIITAAGIDAQDNPYIAYTQPSTLQTMTDVMTASAEATSADGEVELAFNHRLSALDLVVKNSQTESEREIKIKSAYLKLENISSGGTLYFNGTTIPNNASFTTIEHTINTPTTVAYGGEHNINSENSFLFLPCNSIVATVTLTIINSWNEEVQLGITSQSLAPANGFIAGNRYSLIINKTDKGIVFTIEDNTIPWDKNEDINIGFN